jgi:glycosyltransferase involved in cell wall biosynthesis
MRGAPAISILTPVWNGLPYIKECVDSVLAQDFQDWEMIVGDNSSDDGTSEYLQTLTDPRIKVYRHEKNLGVYRNIHFLFNKATAPIYMGLCADDYFYPGALRKIIDEWKKVDDNVGLITFNWKNRQMKQHKYQKFAYHALPKTLNGVHSVLAFFLFGNIPGNFSEVSAKVSLVAPEHYLYDIKFSADYEFWLRLTRRNDLYLTDTEVVYIRRHDRVAATYAITKGEYHEESYQVYEKIIDELSEYCDRAKLIRLYNVELCSYHLRSAINSALRGRFEAFKSFMRLKSAIFWRFQLIRCLPYALSEPLRFSISISVAKSILKELKQLKSKKNKDLVLHA